MPAHPPNATPCVLRPPRQAPRALASLASVLGGLLLSACQTLPAQGPGAWAGTGAQAVAVGATTAVTPAAALELGPSATAMPQTPLSGPPAADDTGASPAAQAAPADLWRRLRRGMRIPSPGGQAGLKVDQHERWYRQNAAHMRRTFTRARLYLHDIVEAVEREGMPLEIALLPAVESAFIPEARSHAAAEGLWQFIAPTGRRFNLKQHMFQDDRRSVRAATQAALRYLDELQARYGGDYQLALAAYNCGEGCIDKAVRLAQARGLPGRYEDLKLNPETADYVPRLLGLARVVAQAVDQGDIAAANLPQMANAPYFAAVPIPRDIDVSLAADLAGMSLADFKALNPQHKRPVIVAAANAEVLVPVERRARLAEAMQHHAGPLATWGAAAVPRRSTVEALAQQHGMPAQVLREVNQIPPGHLVSPGSTVVVARKDAGQDIPELVAISATLATVPAMVRRPVLVSRHEDWASLATRLGVAAAELKAWNPHAGKLRRGQLTLALPITVAERLASLPQVNDRAQAAGAAARSPGRKVAASAIRVKPDDHVFTKSLATKARSVAPSRRNH